MITIEEYFEYKKSTTKPLTKLAADERSLIAKARKAGGIDQLCAEDYEKLHKITSEIYRIEKKLSAMEQEINRQEGRKHV